MSSLHVDPNNDIVMTSYLYLFEGVAAYGVSEVFLSILKPAVEGRRFLRKLEKQFLNLGK